jgi:hypothetical protein
MTTINKLTKGQEIAETIWGHRDKIGKNLANLIDTALAAERDKAKVLVDSAKYLRVEIDKMLNNIPLRNLDEILCEFDNYLKAYEQREG